MVSVTMETGAQVIFRAQRSGDCGPLSNLCPLKQILCIGTVKDFNLQKCPCCKKQEC